MTFKTPLSFPVFEGNEQRYSSKAIQSGHLATHGEFIGMFESALSRRLGTHEAVALNSGTSALHLALVLLGVGPGDEVICQSFTFCASANPIVYLGATPVFVDSERDTWNMSPELLEDAILDRINEGKKPKAIIAVHLFGMPAKMNQIMEISQRYDIPVIEDAAEAIGSTLDGKQCGTFGTIGIFSFNGNKIMTTGGGGALISSDTRLLQKARYLSAQAREDLPYYQHLEIGYNYRMNNMAAAIGLAQLELLDQFIERRRDVNKRYRELLGNMPGIFFLDEKDGVFSNHWLTTITIDPDLSHTNNDKLRILLLKKDIESRFLWKPLHLQPVFRNMPFFGGDVAQSLFQTGLCLPSSVNLSLDNQREIVGLMKVNLSNTIS
ncbi:DegT/DnrJ/EryC1/StrS family aminotransferase [Algoriphagus sediminis]|uniref:DegT/DnrJ/EryC1/StrS family aminotransferase n=1 Tax=Algoriphagus sediminis TaxID=3057113 RepID=A0ABT7YDT9_9BACT|nr:DegT/DnrJ/EryC1/StrS family aminotransferase [Algoriphagus sediminis]MDN3204657.1 DegT/DnrJ/EryC1/StrS family aminotransferase [Algoriphagus sediminis]